MVTNGYRASLLKDHTDACDSASVCETPIAGGNFVVAYTKSSAKNSPNEDACLAMEIDNYNAVLAIADGAGGHPLGHEASSLQIKYLYEALTSEAARPDNLREPILDAIEKCNTELLDRGSGSATTVVVLEICNDVIRPYHVGDSSIVVSGQRGKLKHQTLSHSPVALGIEAGFIEPDNALHDENRHIVLNLVGTQEMRIEIGAPLKLALFDTVLICSDGLTDNLPITSIVPMISNGPLQSSLVQLHSLCLSTMNSDDGYPDDLSVILYRRRREHGKRLT